MVILFTMIKKSMPTYEEAVLFHGHSCPGLAIGYRVSELALQELVTGRSEDEEIVAIVENDACGLDGIQFVTGCTIGKGNLIFNDYGKQVYTFVRRDGSDAVRIVQHPKEVTKELESMQDMTARVFAGTATQEEKELFASRREDDITFLLTAPLTDIFSYTHITPKIPQKARIFRSVPCAKCGEMVSESRARVENGMIVCIPCFSAYSRGW